MFSAFLSFSLPFSISRFLGGNAGEAIDLRSVNIHDIEIRQEKRARTLKHLIKLNHANYSIVYHDFQFHNHMPHHLGSAYLLEGTSESLEDIYEKESNALESWKGSPGEVSTHDWRDYLGNPHYQRAYVDFFEDQLVLNGYDWRKVMDEYLFKGKEPLINCMIAGLGHPLIHLGYAYELSSREIAMEALGIVTTSYNFLHKYLDNPAYSKISTYNTSSPFEILQSVHSDNRFDKIFDHSGASNIEPLFKDHESLVLEYWNAWHLPNPRKQFEDSQRAAVALLVATHKPGRKYDFFLVHLLTTSHAVRILLPFLPAKFHVSLVRQWWLLTLAIYIVQKRPEMKVDRIKRYDTRGRDWKWVDRQAVEGNWALDAHFVKGLRAMKEAAQTWGDQEKFYIKAALKFGEEFDNWGGFGPLDAEGAALELPR